MKFENIYYVTLITQSLVLIIAIISIVFIAFFQIRSKNKIKKLKAKLTQSINTALLQENYDLSKLGNFSKKFQKEALLLTLEELNQNYKGENWDRLRKELVKKHLNAYKKSYHPNAFWKTKTWTARCIRLDPSLEDKETIEKLLDEKSFYVRSLAVDASVELEDKELINKVLGQMTKETKACRYVYRHAFMSGTQKALDIVLEAYKKAGHDDILRICCLDVMMSQVQINLPDQLAGDILSNNQELREIASQFLAKYSRRETRDLLVLASEDLSWKVRKNAIIGLAKLNNPENVPIFEKRLCDPFWDVRFEAGNALLNSGDQGRAILRMQESSLNPISHDIARYLLTSSYDK